MANDKVVTIIVQVRGGVVQGAIANDPSVTVKVVDWDDYHDADDAEITDDMASLPPGVSYDGEELAWTEDWHAIL